MVWYRVGTKCSFCSAIVLRTLYGQRGIISRNIHWKVRLTSRLGLQKSVNKIMNIKGFVGNNLLSMPTFINEHYNVKKIHRYVLFINIYLK